MEIFRENDYSIIGFYKQDDVGAIIWKGNISSQNYRETFMYLLEEQKKLGITKFYSDIRQQGVVSPEDRKWFEQEAMPNAVKQGLRAAAIVFSGNVFKKYYINIILQATNKFDLPMKVFTDPDEALNWLKTR